MKMMPLASFALVTSLVAQNPEFSTPVPTTLSAIRAEAEAFRNVKVTFPAQFSSLGNLSNPFFTRFSPTDFTNFYVWADEQPIWQRADYEDMFGNLFYSKFGEQLQTIFNMPTYQRLQITGIIRNTFQNSPWIEVTEFDLLPNRVNAAVLTHMYRGEQFMAERRWERAIAELTFVPGAGVPAMVQAAAFRNLGVCYLRIGEAAQAVGCLESAVAFNPRHDNEVANLLTTARSQPGAELDRVVGIDDLEDYELPMWELFEGDDSGETGNTGSPQPMR